MKILHLVAGNLSGGAARGAFGLHQAQRRLGIDSTILTNATDTLNDPHVISLAKTPFQKLKLFFFSRFGALPIRLYRKRKPVIFSTGFGGIDFTKHPAYESADVVHLHWVNGLVSMRTLRKVSKPIVWTVRDMWPLTGGCHYSLDCERYTSGCGQCPQLGSTTNFDLSTLIVKNKHSAIPKHLRLVGISQWISNCIQNSYIFRDFKVFTISNNVDTSQFYPVDRELAREKLGIKTAKKIVLVGAQALTEFYKGFGLFLDAQNHLANTNLHFVFFGKVPKAQLEQLGIEFTHLGFISDTVSLRLTYSAADVFVAPSKMEAFGKTLAESMSCGTPVVCFDATGPKDIVEHKVTGYKAKPYDAADLANGICWILTQKEMDYEQLCRQSRLRAQTHFDSNKIATKYVQLYKQMLKIQI